METMERTTKRWQQIFGRSSRAKKKWQRCKEMETHLTAAVAMAGAGLRRRLGQSFDAQVLGGAQ